MTDLVLYLSHVHTNPDILKPHIFFHQYSCGRDGALNLLGREISKQCGFGDRIRTPWVREERRPSVRVKKYAA